MSIEYPSFVNVKKIIEITPPCSSKYRYVLEIPFCNGEDKPAVLVILKNPSKATEKECDMTISKVCNATYNADYGKVIVFNLFPYRSTDPQKVFSDFIQNTSAYEEHMKANLEFMSRHVTFVQDVIFAWGTNTIKNRTGKQYKDVKDGVKRTCQDKCWKMVEGGKKEPLHGLRWSNTSKFIDYKEYV